MARNIPETGAPISENIVEDVADEYDLDTDTVREILDTVQEGMEPFISEYREHQVVAENEDLLVTLSEWGFKEEAKAAREEIDTDLDEWVEDELATIISKAHHAAFRSASLRTLTGFSEQDVTGATSAAYPRIIRKSDDAKPTSGDVDVEYRIQYDHGYESPFHFVARARSTVEGDYGTLKIERTYRCIPDDTSDEPADEIHVTSEAHHAESDTLVNDYVETWPLTEQLPDTPGRIDEYDDNLRWWVYNNHTADFEQEYRDMQDSLDICQECEAYPDSENEVFVEQRSTNQFDPSAQDVLCNHCYGEFLTEATTLSKQEADVYALKESGLSHTQVSDALGGLSRSQVGTVMGRVKEKRQKAEDELVQAKRTSELIREVY